MIPNPPTVNQQPAILTARAYVSEWREWRDVEIMNAYQAEQYAEVEDRVTGESYYYVAYSHIIAITLRRPNGEIVQYLGRPRSGSVTCQK